MKKHDEIDSLLHGILKQGKSGISESDREFLGNIVDRLDAGERGFVLAPRQGGELDYIFLNATWDEALDMLFRAMKQVARKIKERDT